MFVNSHPEIVTTSAGVLLPSDQSIIARLQALKEQSRTSTFSTYLIA